MPRHTRKVPITAEGRDKGKTFIITEMPSDQGERWANRLILALLEANVKVSAQARDGGMAGLFTTMPGGDLGDKVKWLAGMAYDGQLDALLQEQMACVMYQPPGNYPPQPLLEGAACQIEEIPTRWQLRTEWLELHMGFLLAGAESTTGTQPHAPPPA